MKVTYSPYSREQTYSFALSPTFEENHRLNYDKHHSQTLEGLLLYPCENFPQNHRRFHLLDPIKLIKSSNIRRCISFRSIADSLPVTIYKMQQF